MLRLYARVLGQLRPYWRSVLALTLANFILAGLQFLDPLLFGRVIGLISRADTLAPGQLWPEARHVIAIWAGVGLAAIAANILIALQTERLAHGNRLRAMQRFFGHVLGLPPGFHGATQSGVLIKTMLSGADAMFGTWLTLFREALTTLVAVLVLLPLTVLLNWRLSIALIVLALLFCTLVFLVISRTEAGQARAQLYQSRLVGTAQDTLGNVLVVQSFARLPAELRQFEEIIHQVITHQFPVLNWWAVVNVMTRGASTLTVITIVALGTWLHAQGKASIDEVASFVGIATLLIGKLDGAMTFAARLFFEAPNLREYFRVLDTASQVPEQPHAPALRPGPGCVRFEGVTFAYPSGASVLHGVDFVAEPGSRIALVGQTGAGKSTAMALLQRFWDPTAGRILIDDQDIRDVSIDSLRRAIGVVFQESLLFNRSIRDNLMIGRPEASEAELMAACTRAEAADFVRHLPNGLDTVVGERGVNLSGGQRQRLAIARALLKNPPILILDEATSALDAETEARVTEALTELMRGRTSFIVAHRLSTVRHADRILVFNQGRIVEAGGFDALIAQNGVFSRLVEAQLV